MESDFAQAKNATVKIQSKKIVKVWSQPDEDILNQEKYYKKFDFFYRRTAFRTMTEYYKCLFKPYLDRFREIEKKIQRDDFVGET